MGIFSREVYAIFDHHRDAMSARESLRESQIEPAAMDIVERAPRMYVEHERVHRSDTWSGAATGLILGGMLGLMVGVTLALFISEMTSAAMIPLIALGASGGMLYGVLGGSLAGAAQLDRRLRTVAIALEDDHRTLLRVKVAKRDEVGAVMSLIEAHGGAQQAIV